MSDATKQQWNSFGWIFGSLFIGALIVLLEWTFGVPVIYWWFTGAVGLAFTIFFLVRFLKRTFFTSRHEDGGSSVK